MNRLKLSALLVVLLGVPSLPSQGEDREIIRVYRTFYCATGEGCHEKICGGNKKTAWNKDATKEGGFAADPSWCSYGTMVILSDGSHLLHDDNFGRKQRERDRRNNCCHIDIRIANRTHQEVRKMGVEWIQMQVIHEGNHIKLVEIK